MASGRGRGRGAGSGTDSVRDVLRARYSELTQERRFPGGDAYTRAIIVELAKNYEQLYDEQLISQLAAASDERQWLDMLLGSFPVCVEELSAEFSRYSTQQPVPTGAWDYYCYSADMLLHLVAFVETLGAGESVTKLLERLRDGSLSQKLMAGVQDAHGWLQVLLGHVCIEEEDQLRTEFEREYQDPGGEIVSYAVHYIQLCYKNWSEHIYHWYAPCTSLVQSSGWGKSRLMREIAYAQNQVTVLYFSLMELEQRGYPRSNAELLPWFRNISAEEDAYAIFAACFDWLSSQDTFPDKRCLFKKHQESDYGHILEKLRIRPQCSEEDMREACIQAVSKHQSSLKEKGVSFLFVIDEAPTLLKTAGEGSLNTGGPTPFFLFRRACAALPTEARSFVLFVGTVSKQSHFTPSDESDPSTRVVRGLDRLFAPICRLTTFDLPSSLSPSSRSLEDIVKPEILFKQGRPLWASRMSEGAGWTKRIIDLAMTKLLKGYTVGSANAQQLLQSPFMSLVLLGRRIGVDVCPHCHFAEDLVASHMGVCLHVATSGDYVLCTSLPEPVLSEAAALLLRSDPNLLKRQLQGLDALLLNGAASAGEERGELVVRFLLIHAMDSLQVRGSCTQPVLLEDFLRASFHGFRGFTGSLRYLKEAKVFFNAFHRCYAKASLQRVRAFLRKGAAMTWPKNQEAYDLCIPFVLPNGSGEYDVEDDTWVGCVGVLVENRRDFAGATGMMEDMVAYRDMLASTGSVEVTPAFVICVYVGADTAKKPSNHRLSVRLRERVFLVEGLDCFRVIEGLQEVIKVLLWESPDHPVTSILGMEKQFEEEDSVHAGMATDEAIARETNALKSMLASVCGNTHSQQSTEITGSSDRPTRWNLRQRKNVGHST